VHIARTFKTKKHRKTKAQNRGSCPALMDPGLQNVSGTLDWSGSIGFASKGQKCSNMGRFWTDPAWRLHKRL